MKAKCESKPKQGETTISFYKNGMKTKQEKTRKPTTKHKLEGNKKKKKTAQPPTRKSKRNKTKTKCKMQPGRGHTPRCKGDFSFLRLITTSGAPYPSETKTYHRLVGSIPIDHPPS